MTSGYHRAVVGPAVLPIAAGLVALLVSAIAPAASPRHESAARPLPEATALPSGGPSPAHRRHGRAPRPVRVEIPAIGVRAPVVPLGLDRDRTLQVPTRFDVVGWYTGGPRPGEPGPAVVAGHVDSHTGPAVFYRLRDLRRGDAITFLRRDGSRVRFRVRRTEHYAKDRFPSDRVYGPTHGPALRLITCSGTFDRVTGHYLDNAVVYADPV